LNSFKRGFFLASHDLELQVVAENLAYAHSGAAWRSMAPEDQARWINAAEFVLEREAGLYAKAAAARSRRRLLGRLESRLLTITRKYPFLTPPIL
jgi:hypothetical protein